MRELHLDSIKELNYHPTFHSLYEWYKNTTNLVFFFQFKEVFLLCFVAWPVSFL